MISNLTAQLTKKIKLDTRIYLSYVDRTMNKAVKNVMDKSRYEKMSVDLKVNRRIFAGTKELEEEMLQRVHDLRDRTDDYRAMVSVFGRYEILKGLSFLLLPVLIFHREIRIYSHQVLKVREIS